VDGRLIDHEVVSPDLAAPAVSRVKVIANLNLGERRLPQDGRTTFVVQGKQVDVRVATSPTVFGESAVLRILDRSSVPLDLEALGLSQELVRILKQAARAAHGMFLITGPTGSGKTTTLYALLQTFVGSGKKVLSIEDPVEYHFEHVSQTQVAAQVGLTFATALRSFLRQDPDVILVGEIRDPETAAVAVQAAMTGHFVLASVHANSALAVLPRLRDIGIEPYQIAAGFRGAMAQRLVRKLCPRCGEDHEPNEFERLFLKSVGQDEPQRLRHARGCAHCKGTGFKGRVPIGEAFQADEALLRAVADRAPAADIERIARSAGLKDMAADGAEKALAGVTTLEEVATALHG
jgi:type II secretory ATPase GspE/PulE/Tfp pilus assembly ATPase PilB-like protein